MSDSRGDILRWLAQGQIAAKDLPAALQLAGLLPDRAGWRVFLEALLLWLGMLLTAAGVIFFVAFNWDALGRHTQFLLVEAALAVTVAAALWLGPERAGGKAALAGAVLVTGALLALVGQTYQTGADTFELFAVWALLVLPWVIVARIEWLWLFWWLLVNAAVALYVLTLPTVFGLLFAGESLGWSLYLLNGAALLLREFAGQRGVDWLTGRAGPRLLALASGTSITLLATAQLFDRGEDMSLAIPVWIAAVVLTIVLYRRWLPDLFMLAATLLSVVIFCTTAIAREVDEFGGFLLVGLAVIAMATAGAAWLRRVAADMPS